MIKTFKDPEAERIFNGQSSTKLPADIQNVARRKLRQLDAAVVLADMRVPPGNLFEALKGDRKGQYSVRINDQWRVCFKWDEGPTEVEITDYH